MNIDKLKFLLRTNEGVRNRPYRCTANKLSIGVGRNLDDVGLSNNEIEYLLDNDITKVLSDLVELFDDFGDLPEEIQLVLADMRFNLGGAGLRKFKKMIAAVKRQDWVEMQKQMIFSKWFYDVGGRAARLLEMVDTVIDQARELKKNIDR